MIQAKVIADSKNPYGDRLTTMLVTFPRIILAEFNTHRMFSRNSASSRAIPFKKMVETIKENSFIPIAWQKDHKGMQGNEYIIDEIDIQLNKDAWLKARDNAISLAEYLNHGVKEGRDNGVTKQLCNRLLEPFMWTTVVVSATEWENFFALRCPQYPVETDGNPIYFRSRKDLIKSLDVFPRIQEAVKERSELDWIMSNKGQAEIHMMALAEAMWDAYNESTPEKLEVGDWHIPYKDKGLALLGRIYHINSLVDISTMMCARTSYTVLGDDGKEWTAEKYLEGCKKLKEANPFHASPFEHCAIVPTEEEYFSNIRGYIPTITDNSGILNYETYRTGEYASGLNEECGWFGNFKGFKQYRKMFNNENITK